MPVLALELNLAICDHYTRSVLKSQRNNSSMPILAPQPPKNPFSFSSKPLAFPAFMMQPAPPPPTQTTFSFAPGRSASGKRPKSKTKSDVTAAGKEDSDAKEGSDDKTNPFGFFKSILKDAKATAAKKSRVVLSKDFS